MNDYLEVDFLGVETGKSGDAITVRYAISDTTTIHVVDGGYLDTGDQIVEHLSKYYGTKRIDHVILTHPDQDHANGLRKVLDECEVDRLWMNRPWLYASELIDRFATYNSVDALRRTLRSLYAPAVALEQIAIAKGIPISAPFQGEAIGAFKVLAPKKSTYLNRIVESSKTPDPVREGVLNSTIESIFEVVRAATKLIKGTWGDESFPTQGTSAENEMSVVQSASINEKQIVLTGDVGRSGLAEAAEYAPMAGLCLPGVSSFQVPHHGGRHNVDTDVLDRWLGERLPSQPATTSWNAVCSSAKADDDHPRKSVVRAMLHRGAHFSATEGRTLHIGYGIKREDWSSVEQAPYPEEQEV